MNARSVRYYLGHILRWEAVLMLPSLFVSLYDGEWAAVKAFLITTALLLWYPPACCISVSRAPTAFRPGRACLPWV